MKIIGGQLALSMPLGIVIGVIGIALCVANYPIYKKILKARKDKYSAQIIELSSSLLNK